MSIALRVYCFAALLMLIMLPVLAASPADLFWQGHILYKMKQYEKCSATYEAAIRAGMKDPDVFYNAAGCYSLSGMPDAAFKYLAVLCQGQGQFYDIEGLLAEPDFVPLHSDPRWPTAVQACKTAEHSFLSQSNMSLYGLFLRVRNNAQIATNQKEEVLTLVSRKLLRTSPDFYHGAGVLALASDPESLKLASTLAKKAMEMIPPHLQPGSLFAAATDRYLWSIHEPQIYGTQVRQDEKGNWTSEPFNPSGVTDEERAARGVLTLQLVRQRLKMLNQGIR